MEVIRKSRDHYLGHFGSPPIIVLSSVSSHFIDTLLISPVWLTRYFFSFHRQLFFPISATHSVNMLITVLRKFSFEERDKLNSDDTIHRFQT
jgi:hypothetical protein